MAAAYGQVSEAQVELGTGYAAGYEARTTAGEMDATKAAQLGRPTTAAEAGYARAATVSTAQRDAISEAAAMGEAAQRAGEKDYVEGAATTERVTVDQPENIDVATRSSSNSA